MTTKGPDQHLIDAYLATRITIWSPAPIAVTGPDPAPTLPWGRIAVVTAWNPASQPTPDTNPQRNADLAHLLTAAGLTLLPAEGRSPDGTWWERSYAIPNPPLDLLLAAARTTGQHAIFTATTPTLTLIPTTGTAITTPRTA